MEILCGPVLNASLKFRWIPSVFFFFPLHFSYVKCHMVRKNTQDLDFFGYIFFSSVPVVIFSSQTISSALHGSKKWGNIFNLAAKNQCTTPKGWQSGMQTLLWLEKYKHLLLDKSIWSGPKSNAFISKWLDFNLDLWGEEKVQRIGENPNQFISP